MIWNKGFTYKIYGRAVDPASWADKETFSIVNGDISKQDNDLRESATIEVQDYDPDREMWIRVYMDISQNNDSYHVPIFTGLATSPSKDIDGNAVSTKMECYSVLKPLDDVLLPRGWYARAYREPNRILDELLEPCFAPVTYGEELHELTNHILAEDNESNLSMLDKVLEALNLVLKIDGHGRITITTPSTEPVATFTSGDFDIIEPKLSYSNDWFSCPNVVMAIDEELMAIARDDDENSPLSTVNRGREIWHVEDGVNLAENDTLAEYARRLLTKLQDVKETLSYTRAYVPDIGVGDVIRLRYNQFAGLYRITRQKFDMDGSVSEEVAKL